MEWFYIFMSIVAYAGLAVAIVYSIIELIKELKDENNNDNDK